MMKSRLNHRWVLFFVILLLGSIASPACHPLISRPSKTIPAKAGADFQLMAEAWNEIERVYVDRAAVNPRTLTYGAISGMVEALGDTGHSRFLTPEMVKQERHLTQGELEGIGAELQMKNSQVVIVAPMDDSPALKAGLKPGDIILKVNGEEIGGLPMEQLVNRILGPSGSLVKLNILNPGTNRAFDVSIVRARVTIHSITWHRLPGKRVAHLRIAIFSKGVTKELRKTLVDMEKEGITGLILDLRNNPGGLFDEAVSTASQFLKDGNVLLERNSAGKIEAVPVEPGGVGLSFGMVALVNGGTSSGAEIVAGALRDGHRARLVGEKTFGTGTVLQEIRLSDGSALLLAIREWLTPAGHRIWHRGITPDVVVPLPPEAIPLLPVTEKGMTAEQLKASRDTQFLRALDDLLHGETRPGS